MNYALQLLRSGLFLLAMSSAQAAEETERQRSVEIIWSSPVAAEPEGREPRPGTVVLDIIPRSNDVPAALATENRAFFIIDDLTVGPTKRVRLDVNGASPPKVIAASDGTYWVAGTKYRYRRVGLKGLPFAMIYLARFGANGAKLSERVYDHTRPRELKGIAALRSGDLVLVGYEKGWMRGGRQEPDATWVRRISTSGGVVWDQTIDHEGQRFGDSESSAVAVLDSGQIAVVALESEGGFKTESRRDHVRLWLFAEDGKPLRDFRVRDALNGRFESDQYLHATADTSLYVTSHGGNRRRPGNPPKTPVQIAKVDPTSRILWTATLPDSEACYPNLTRSQEGELFVTCAYKNNFTTYRIDHTSGAVTHFTAELPECQHGKPTTTFVVPDKRSDALLLVGTSIPPQIFVGSSCTWLGTAQ